MRWIDKARDVAKEYRANCKELKQIQDSESYDIRSGGAVIRSGKISKPVEAAVERRMMEERAWYLKKSIDAVDYALEMVLQKPNGAETLKLFNMVYWDRSHTLYGAANKIYISEKTAKRYNHYLLKMIAAAMGFLNAHEK